MAATATVLPFRRKRTLAARAALKFLYEAGRDGLVEVASYTDLATMLGWERRRARTAVQRWAKAGKVNVETDPDGRLAITVRPDRRFFQKGKGTGLSKPKAPPPRKRAKSRVQTDIKNDAKSDVTSNTLDDIKVLNSPVEPKTYRSREISGKEFSERHPRSENTSIPDLSPAAENTSPEEVSSAAMEAPEAPISDRPQEHTGTAVERASIRPVSRRGGGGVVGGGGGGPGFDAVDTFRRASFAERILILIAAGLSGTAAYMSVTGMVVMYPFEPTVIMVFGALIEAAKFFGFGVLAAGWSWYGGFSRLIAASLLLVAATINASGVYGRLISDHVGPAADRTANYTTADAGQGAKVEVSQARVQDLDRRISQIDDAISAATRRGRSNGAMRLAEREKRNRAQLAGERDQAQQELANLKAGRTSLGARHQEAEASSTPVKYAAALFEDVGLLKPGTDPEKLMRWISFLILLTGDPLALALIWTMNSRTRRHGGA